MASLTDRIPIPARTIGPDSKIAAALVGTLDLEIALGGARSINMAYQEQKQTEWCWATCATMVGDFRKPTRFEQCQFASNLYGLACCGDALPNGCNRPCMVADVAKVYDSIAISSMLVSSVVPYAKLEEEIAAGRPVEVGIAWNAGSGHVVLISGTDSSSGKQFVELKDPWPSSKNGKTGKVLYDDLAEGFGRGKWKWTWIGIE